MGDNENYAAMDWTILERLWEKMHKKGYRVGYTQAQMSVRLPFQMRELRKKRGWTQAELSRRSNVSISQICKMEQTGGGPRSFSVLCRLCDAFDVCLSINFASFSDVVKQSDKFKTKEFNVKSFCDDDMPERDDL